MRPDFQRDVHCVLGLPFDAVTLDHATDLVRDAARRQRRCFLSTPNLNFAVAARSDAAFRNSVIRSDLSVADGMPLVWIARLLGVPLPERVAGSAMFERLRRASGPAITVFFFGGADGVAARACERLNAEGGGLQCVGHDAPGFVPVAAMSDPSRIERINAAAADFVVVALGAAKGQSWIERNRHALRAPVISHLGAVLNFVAGTVVRAPAWMQRVGLEWLWRIKEEPALWRRYASDAVELVGLLTTRILPAAWLLRRHAPGVEALAQADCQVHETDAGVRLTLRGAWAQSNLAPLRHALERAASATKDVEIDLADVPFLDNAATALFALLWSHQVHAGLAWRLNGVHPRTRRLLHLGCVEYLMQPTPPRPAASLCVEGK